MNKKTIYLILTSVAGIILIIVAIQSIIYVVDINDGFINNASYSKQCGNVTYTFVPTIKDEVSLYDSNDLDNGTYIASLKNDDNSIFINYTGSNNDFNFVPNSSPDIQTAKNLRECFPDSAITFGRYLTEELSGVDFEYCEYNKVINTAKDISCNNQ